MNTTPSSDPPTRLLRFSKRLVAGLTAALAGCVIVALLYYVRHGGMIARQKPSAIESAVAERILRFSVPTAAKAMRNPLDSTGANLSPGLKLYRENCESCHGYDGRGATKLSSGLYPQPVDLQNDSTTRKTDGELFYFIRNGVRNTAMPGWQLPDEQTWQLVLCIRSLPKTAQMPASQEALPNLSGAHYVGSAACQKCHVKLYESWKKTLMANVVRDPREHPDAIIPDLAHADPMVKFTAEDVALVYGSKWKQRYFKKVGDDYYVFPAQWDVAHKKWRPYVAKDDWWAPLYPPDNFQRPTGALCDGCHSVNYEIKTKTVTEWNVGCEKCHGPGGKHVENPIPSTILNPLRMDYVAGNDLCIQCHSQGRPLTNPIDGKYYDWPVGYETGKQLKDYWKLEDHKLGETTFTHFADGTAHKNRMQGNDYVTSLMYTHGVSCFTCHDSHGTENPSLLRKPASALCLDCHGPQSPNGPFAPTLEAHTHHKTDSAGSECIACHMPKIAQTIAEVNVRSHTFHFVSPAVSESLKVPNACNVCHTDKSNEWTKDALKSWVDSSPWRVAQ